MKKVVFKDLSFRSLFSSIFNQDEEKVSPIGARDTCEEINLVGLPSGIEVVKLSYPSSYAIYLNGKRIVQVHWHPPNSTRNSNFFSKQYISLFEHYRAYYKDYEPAQHFQSLANSITETRDKYGGHLFKLDGNIIMRTVWGENLTIESLRYLFSPRVEKKSIMREPGFEYHEEIDPVFAVTLFLLHLLDCFYRFD